MYVLAVVLFFNFIFFIDAPQGFLHDQAGPAEAVRVDARGGPDQSPERRGERRFLQLLLRILRGHDSGSFLRFFRSSYVRYEMPDVSFCADDAGVEVGIGDTVLQL